MNRPWQRGALFVVLLSCAGACGEAEPVTPDVPVATMNVTGPVLRGEVTISFAVSDPASRLVNVRILHGTTTTPSLVATPSATSPGIMGLTTAPQGVPYTFLWDTVADLGYARTESIYLALEVTAGAVVGIGARVGPFVVDNTGLEQVFDVEGNVTRASGFINGPATQDLSNGTLWIGLFRDEPLCPPQCTPSKEPKNLRANLDLSDRAGGYPSIPFQFTDVPMGRYKITAMFDHNNNAVALGCLIDAGDLVNATDMLVDVTSDVTNRLIVLNYINEFNCN